MGPQFCGVSNKSALFFVCYNNVTQGFLWTKMFDRGDFCCCLCKTYFIQNHTTNHLPLGINHHLSFCIIFCQSLEKYCMTWTSAMDYRRWHKHTNRQTHRHLRLIVSTRQEAGWVHTFIFKFKADLVFHF